MSIPAEPLDFARLRRANDGYGWRHVILIYASVYLLAGIGFIFWTYWHPVTVVLVMPFLGAQIYKITIIMHDCCHSSLFVDRRTNQWVGIASGFFVGTSFSSFCAMHWKHHATYGADDDPQGDDYLNLETAPRKHIHIAWHLIRPLFGYNLTKLIKFHGRGVGAEAVLSAPAAPAEKWVFLGGTGFVQLTIVAVATGGFNELWLALLYPACAATFALFFSQVRGFVEHVTFPGVSPVRHARTHMPNIVDRLFFYTLNFNYHIEHHKYPHMPSVHLPEVHDQLKQRADYGDVSPSISKTISKRLRAS